MLPHGYRLVQNGGSHLQVVAPDGSLLRSPTGVPIAVSLSPSDHRTRKNEVARIRRALDAR